MRDLRWLWAVMLVVVLVEVASTATADAPRKPSAAVVDAKIDELERLSNDLREHRLSPAERVAFRADLAGGADPQRVYDDALGRWLDPPTLSRLVDKLVGPRGDVSTIFLGLERVRQGATWVYFLPHTVTDRAVPCTGADVVDARPWWSKDSIKICKASYRPEHSFDKVGFCAGQPEPTVPAPPRAGCGCGALLLACLPPRDEHPEIIEGLNAGISDEIGVTALDIVRKDRPFDDIMTATTTWQNGLVELMYLRRELLGEIARQPYSPELERRLRQRLDAVDLSAPGHWVARTGIYRDSGLPVSTIAATMAYASLRVMSRVVLESYLCTEFLSVHVDSESLLKAVGGQHANLRAFGAIGDSPMRHTVGCDGCHAPMDNTAAFLIGLQTALYGSYPTGLPAKGQLYVGGAHDYRGTGEGFAALSRLVVAQPEFPRCMAKRTFALFVRRPLREADRVAVQAATKHFEEGGRSWLSLVREILRSDAYVSWPTE